jgi:hypothetical protein
MGMPEKLAKMNGALLVILMFGRNRNIRSGVIINLKWNFVE